MPLSSSGGTRSFMPDQSLTSNKHLTNVAIGTRNVGTTWTWRLTALGTVDPYKSSVQRGEPSFITEVKVTVKLPLCTVQLHAYLISAPDAGVRSASRPGWAPSTNRIPGCVGPHRSKSLAPAGKRIAIRLLCSLQSICRLNCRDSLPNACTSPYTNYLLCLSATRVDHSRSFTNHLRWRSSALRSAHRAHFCLPYDSPHSLRGISP